MKIKVGDPVTLYDSDCIEYTLHRIYTCHGDFIEPRSEEYKKLPTSTFGGDGSGYYRSYYTNSSGAVVDFDDVPPGLSTICVNCCEGASSEPVQIENSGDCEPGYRSLTGTSSWTPPANATSVTITIARGSATVTTPSNSGTMWNRTSQTWSREEFGSIGWGNFKVQGAVGNARIQIGYILC